MTTKLFGTDGVRGTANAYPMTADVALKIGMAAGAHFTNGDHRHTVVIGKDTRLSGYLLEPALTAGFISVGMDVILVGPMPTPAVAMLTRSLRADLGVVISASHNPFEDNGIKLFGPDGFKLSDATEDTIEHMVHNGLDALRVGPERLGRARRMEDASGRYIEYVKGVLPRDRRFDGLKVVVDCANGAAYKVAPMVLWELGAEVIPIGVEPNGTNINKGCGSLYPERMQQAVVTHGADIGIALDGDADRIQVCDETGRMIDGDQLMGLIAAAWKREGKLQGDALVATVMSNLGLQRYLESVGLAMVRTKVGDRYVVEAMREGGYNLGGEQSGHIVLGGQATTGDGLMAGLEVLSELVRSGRKASELLHVFETVPQLLKNVRMADRAAAKAAMGSDVIRTAIGAADKRLAEAGGRLLIRESGTEPVVRVMAEGDDAALVKDVVEGLCDAIAREAAKEAA
ncbi:phosphoglucosamine mutase [Caenispirillum bisanense]|uniref:Phosphoglucosamine mutase n=1 Tax=Caenispirillum bisanense TaxID=414052 RepID=A0A286GQ10_9PROT|nr:phosphoglucosamine mutase [Caenispirillum bisanense]SOD97592.1 phosphoglucosamine mutase [Caenispirillum bisanense]